MSLGDILVNCDRFQIVPFYPYYFRVVNMNIVKVKARGFYQVRLGRHGGTKALSVLSVGHYWPPRTACYAKAHLGHGLAVRTSHGLSYPS